MQEYPTLEGLRHFADDLTSRFATAELEARTEAYIAWSKEAIRACERYSLLGDAGAMQACIRVWYDLEDDLRVARKPVPTPLREAIKANCGYRCQYCGEAGGERDGPDGRPWHIDHIDPWSGSGQTAPDNLTLACSNCNIRKGNQVGWEPGGFGG